MSGLGYALGARAAIRRGDVLRGTRDLGRADRVRSRLNRAMPWFAVRTLLEIGNAGAALGDADAVESTLREVDVILRQRPRLGTLVSDADALRTRLEALRAARWHTAAISAAEMRVVPFLPTHLTFAEIGRRLYVSPHTVKTQAVSIYRKLGVTSRADAIDGAIVAPVGPILAREEPAGLHVVAVQVVRWALGERVDPVEVDEGDRGLVSHRRTDLPVIGRSRVPPGRGRPQCRRPAVCIARREQSLMVRSCHGWSTKLG